MTIFKGKLMDLKKWKWPSGNQKRVSLARTLADAGVDLSKVQVTTSTMKKIPVKTN